MRYQVKMCGGSRSFPENHAFLEDGSDRGEILVLAGDKAGEVYSAIIDKDGYVAILIELGTECLGVHTGEKRGEEGNNVLGFARFRLGGSMPSSLVEIVRQPKTREAAIAAARQIFEGASLKTAVCADFPGRIVDRLLRPYYNAALNRLDAKLATAADMDLTLKLGLGYPEGPIELLERTGLAAHFDVTNALYNALGDPAYAPARRAQVAKARENGGE